MQSDRIKLPELLSPAGSYESLIAAVNAGADAVYMGGSKFGARAYADNPEEDRYLDALHYAHRYGVKVYMTVNTLFKEQETARLKDWLLPYYTEGVDAIIVQDLGAFRIMHEAYPDLPMHASTQMAVTDEYHARLLRRLGIKRVVPARELSLEELKRIKAEGVEVESFVHGALCYSYSGQCFMSSLIGGRSGNRGRCAQSCRLDYEGTCEGCRASGKLLSLKDLCSLDLVPQLAEAGIDSFKMEGRMKSPRYTAGITEVWRKYLDLYAKEGSQGYHVENKDCEMLANLFDRGGRTDGYYFRHNGQDMMAWDERKYRGSQEELYAYLDERYVNSIRKVSVSGSASIVNGSEMSLAVSVRGRNGDELWTAVSGDIPDRAQKRAISEDDVRKQLEKTGGTPYEWENLDISLDDGLFIPMGKINDLRRKALDAAEEVIRSEYKRTLR